MASPTSRLLELLELLQTRPLTTGREIADRLGIDARTARRYVGVLQELGIPVEGQRGVGGGYRIRPGLPAAAVDARATRRRSSSCSGCSRPVAPGRTALPRRSTARSRRSTACCRRRFAGRWRRWRRRSASRRSRGSAPADAACGAPARRRDPPPPAGAHRLSHVRRRRVGARGQPVRPRRPPRPLVPRRARPPARRPAHLPGRPDRGGRQLVDTAALAPPADFDPVEHVTRSLASVPWKWEVEVLLDLTVRRGGAAHPADAGRARRRSRRHAAADARRLARLDGDRPRRARLRLHDPAAGRAAGERPCARGAAGGATSASRGRRRSPGCSRPARGGEASASTTSGRPRTQLTPM